MAYVFQPYPSIRYFRESDGHIGTWTVHDADEDRALGKGFYDNPGKVPELAPVRAEAPVAGTSPAEAALPAAPAPKHRAWSRKRGHEGAIE